MGVSKFLSRHCVPHSKRARIFAMEQSSRTPEGSEADVELDPEQLSPGALRGLGEEYVTREGTEYGEGDWSLEDKVVRVLRQLACGEARIVFDLELESASIVTAPELALHVLEASERGSARSD